jgi:hypothetical protein
MIYYKRLGKGDKNVVAEVVNQTDGRGRTLYLYIESHRAEQRLGICSPFSFPEHRL